jgi:hypothetical protein
MQDFDFDLYERVARSGNKKTLEFPQGPFANFIPAASYFPTQLPAQYHWR